MPFAESILVATDLSQASHVALAEAARVVELSAHAGGRFVPARVCLLHVFDVSPFLPENVTLSQSTLRRIAEEANGAAHSVLSNLRAKYFAAPQQVELHTVEHDGAAAGICATAKLLGSDLIIIASHGRSARAHAALGSVTEKVVRTAHCRVLVVPALELERHTH